MKRKNLLIILCCLIMSLGFTLKSKAQIIIGEATVPEAFSVLELSTAITKGGLRLPHLTTVERDALGFISKSGTVSNQGLMIYNTTTDCIEYWNDIKWVSLCLGTANIELESSCGNYDASKPPISEAINATSKCIYTPKDNPECIVPSGQAYQVYLTSGDAYVTLDVDPITSGFSVSFIDNNSSQNRTAIVRVVNNCSGEFQDFIFAQKGADCPNLQNPILNASTLTLCDGGSAFAYIQNAEVGANYIWTYAGVVVHTGSYYEIKRAGTYTVYPGLIGCGQEATVTVAASNTKAPKAPYITATNSGILCGGGKVSLRAETSDPVIWYHNGKPTGNGANPLEVSGASNEGEWFAAVSEGTCSSSSSNKVQLLDQTTSSVSLATPKMSIDGKELTGSGSQVFCANGSIVLDVLNASSYPEGVSYEWFVNGNTLGRSGKANYIFNVPAGLDKISISVEVSNRGVNCPNTTISPSTNITFTASGNTNINNGDTKAFICGGAPALLVAGLQGADAYEWYENEKLIPGANTGTYSTTNLGRYKVRYKSANGCWSKFSPDITVENNFPISMTWSMAPGDVNNKVIYGETESYSVTSAPAADSYIWSAYRADGVTEIPIYVSTSGTVGTITYPKLTVPEEITIKVLAKNGCGQTTLSKKVTLDSGCNPVNSVNITPNGAKLSEGKAMQFTANSAGATNYQWKLDGVIVGADQATYNYSQATIGTHTLSVTASGCGGSATATITIQVNPDFSLITSDNTGQYSISGKACYDVRMTATPACGPLESRNNDFVNSNTFTYTFNHSTPYTELKFYIADDNKNVISSTSVVNKDFKIVFRDDIREYIKNNDLAEVTIIAVFKNNAKDIRKVTKSIRIQDCSCCGAKVSLTEWKVFKCHNLGVKEDLEPLVPSLQLIGHFYQWGTNEALVAPPSSISYPGTWPRGTVASSSAWNGSKGPKDPCPTGFRVPTKAEFEGLWIYNKKEELGSFNDEYLYNKGYLFEDVLYLPVSGYRQSGDGSRTLMARPFYWTSTSAGSNDAVMFSVRYDSKYKSQLDMIDGYYKNNATPIRCIAE
ncbi:hypothetical protein [Myroides injenensis]|uniref:hypothetical protein n=1 Tax=Myroides injenensis TaxID=1183151 RepID=UPI0011473CE0|nr:hypothetical protein [Myroides injenensis]